MSASLPELPWYHVGPHGYYDLVRLARRGRTSLVRVAYAIALLIALTLVHNNMAPRSAQRLDAGARVAERFCITIIVMQNLAVLVLTPIYMAASIQEERDRGTFALLFTTHLTAGQILLGKWLARSGHVGAILLSGVPILCFVQLWGGVDMPMLLANFWNTACLVLCVGALSLVIAIKTHSLILSVVKTYLFLSALFLCCCAPQQCFTGNSVFLLMPVGSLGGKLDGYTMMAVAVGVFTFAYAVPTIWLLCRAALLLETMRTDSAASTDDLVTHWRALGRHRFWQFPPIADDAIAWKERHLDESAAQFLPIFAVPIVVFLLLPHFCVWIARLCVGVDDWHESGALDELAMMFEIIQLGCFLIYTLLVAFRLAGCIGRERQRRTLETLLTIPGTRRDLLLQKLKGILLRYRTWLLLAGIPWLYLMMFGDGARMPGFALLIVMPVHLAFFAMLGLFLSVRCRTTATANGTLGGVLFLLCIGLPLTLAVAGASSDTWLSQRGWNPLACWFTIAVEWSRKGLTAERAIVQFTLLYAFATCVLWVLTCRRFAHEPMDK